MTKTLVLGGTAWLGQEIARQLVARGDDVTCLARGASGSAPAGVTFVRADRAEPRAYDSVAETDWDDVIELSYNLAYVTAALDALAARARHWTLVSSVAVYADRSAPGAAEDAELVEPVDLHVYGQVKVAVERATEKAVGDRLFTARPGIIGGPGDPTDRFGYWVTRLARAGSEPVLVPRSDDRPVQVIDVRDVTSWLLDAALAEYTGIADAVGREYPLATLVRRAARVAEFTGELVYADDGWLVDHDVRYVSGPRSLPLWLPPSGLGFAQRSRARYLAMGGPERGLDVMLGDALADERRRGLDRPRASGLTRAEEQDLLARLGR